MLKRALSSYGARGKFRELERSVRIARGDSRATLASGIVHQIRREKRTTKSEVIVRGKRNIKQNRNWFYFKFSVESSSFILQTSLPFVWFYQSVFLSKFVAFHPRTVKRILTALMPSLLFRCFSLFLPHLRTLAQEKRSQNCLRFATGGPSLCIHYCREI